MLSKTQRNYIFVFLVIVSIARVGAAGDPASQSTGFDRVDCILRDYSAGTMSEDAARAALRKLDAMDAVTALVNSIRTKQHSRLDERILAYEALIWHGGESDAKGRAQLIEGLDDAPPVQRLCCAALDPNTLSDSLRVRLSRIEDASVDVGQKVAMLRSLGGWGPCAAEAVTICEKAFADPSAEERLRWAAASCLIGVGGLDKAMAYADSIDAVGRKVILWAAARYIGESPNQTDNPPPDDAFLTGRKLAQGLVNKSLASTDGELRKAALEAYGTIWGADLVVLGEDGQHGWNPEARLILTTVAEDDPNPDLRRQARQILEVSLEDVVRRIKRMQERAQHGP